MMSGRMLTMVTWAVIAELLAFRTYKAVEAIEQLSKVMFPSPFSYISAWEFLSKPLYSIIKIIIFSAV